MSKKFNTRHTFKLENKLAQLIKNSKWKTLGRPDLILNLTSKPLSDIETEALSFGLKFATGKHSKITTNTTLKKL